MERPPAAPPAQGTSQGGSAASRATTLQAARAVQPPSFRPAGGPEEASLERAPGALSRAAPFGPQPFPRCSPGRPRTSRPGPTRPPRPPGPRAGWVPERRRPDSFVERRPTFSTAPRAARRRRWPRRVSRRCRSRCRRCHRPLACCARSLRGGRDAYGRRRTTFPTRGCVTGRHVPGQRGLAPSGPSKRAGRGTRVPP